MNNKIAFSILVIFIFLTATGHAKPKEQSQQQMTIEDIVAKMKTQLGLSDAQAVKVKPVIENYMAQEKQLKLEEKKQLGRVLTGQQLFTWDFLQKEPPKEKKKHASF